MTPEEKEHNERGRRLGRGRTTRLALGRLVRRARSVMCERRRVPRPGRRWRRKQREAPEHRRRSIECLDALREAGMGAGVCAAFRVCTVCTGGVYVPHTRACAHTRAHPFPHMQRPHLCTRTYTRHLCGENARGVCTFGPGVRRFLN